MPNLKQSKVVVVHNYNQAFYAMKAASKIKKKIYILSPENAASYMGPLFFKKLLKKAEKSFPKVKYCEILNCNNDIGLALEAIQCGIKSIEIKCNQLVLKKIKNICKKEGVSVNNVNKKKLDLEYVENVYDECLKWFDN
tara:strand:- start:55 stop:471 length:417 start_codon:yes stop_codon:yes gene_type:complete